MLVERMFELGEQVHAQHRLAVLGRLDLVEDGERELVLGLERVEPVAGRAARELDEQFAADIGGDSDRGAGERGTCDDAGIAVAESERAVLTAAGPAAALLR